jgi:hypothetical protein
MGWAANEIPFYLDWFHLALLHNCIASIVDIRSSSFPISIQINFVFILQPNYTLLY